MEQKTYFKYNTKALIAWAVVLFWMALIFYFSSQPAQESNKLSLGLTGMLLKWLQHLSDFAISVGINPGWINQYNVIIRKLAHTSVFFVLAILVQNAFNQSRIKGRFAIIYSLLFCALYACTDEIHQLFVPGRACMVIDVIIDSTGAALGLGFWLIGRWLLINVTGLIKKPA